MNTPEQSIISASRSLKFEQELLPKHSQDILFGTATTPFAPSGPASELNTLGLTERTKQSLNALEGLVRLSPLSEQHSPNPQEGSLSRIDSSLSEPTPVSIFHPPLFEDYRTAIVQLWEGRVVNLDQDSKVMQVILQSKVGDLEDHSAEISLEWVAPQDLELVRPGAIFYWTIYKETKRGSIINSQELRFRRLPSWSKPEIDRIHATAATLAKRLRDHPTEPALEG